MPTAGSLDLPSFRATVDHRAGAGGSARQRGDQRHHARASRETGPARRAVGFGADSAPSGIDRPRPPVPHRPAACSCERRCGGEQAAPAPAAARGAVGRERAGGGRGRGRAVCERPAGSGFGALARWRSAEGKAARAGARAWPSLAVCAPPRPQERGLSKSGSIEPFHSLWGCDRCAGCSLALAPYDGERGGVKMAGNPRCGPHCESAHTTTPRAVFGHGHEGCAWGGEAATCSGAARPGGQRARARGTPYVCVRCG